MELTTTSYHILVNIIPSPWFNEVKRHEKGHLGQTGTVAKLDGKTGDYKDILPIYNNTFWCRSYWVQEGHLVK